MRIAIFGLGYVGAVSCACLAELGHDILGVDINETKVAQINAGASPIMEAQLDTLITKAVQEKRLCATTDGAEAVAWADASLLCVGTPSRPNGSLDTSYVEHVICSIGDALSQREGRHTVIVRSTLLPGTTLGRLKPLLEAASGKRCGPDIGLAYNPEFLREGTAVKDFYAPPYTVVGGIDEASADVAAAVYGGVNAPVHRVTIPEAEMLKYGANAFHALKITFANELGVFSKSVDVDSHRILDLLTQDTKLNISPAYLKPGFAYGGSCLPKDLRAILYAARQHDLELPLLQSLPRSNALHIQRGIDLVLEQNCRKIGVLGLSFKAGTDDLRESPIIQLIEALIGKGCQLKLYDRNVNWAKVMGANRRYIESVIPHISELMVNSVDEVIAHADVLIVGNNSPEFADLPQKAADKRIIDLVRLPGTAAGHSQEADGRYHGICW